MRNNRLPGPTLYRHWMRRLQDALAAPSPRLPDPARRRPSAQAG